MKTKNNYQLLLLAGVVLVIFIVLAFIVLSTGGIFENKNRQTQYAPITSETGVDTETDPVKIEKEQQSSNVMSLLNKTPYYGKDFSFFYSYEGNFFTLYINPSNPVAGNAEFEQFLRENGVNDRAEIYDLRVVSVSPIPQP